MDKDKKKTLTISSGLKKKIDTTSLSTSGKKSFSVEKKKSFRSNKPFNKTPIAPNNISEDKKRNFNRKFIEQQATKDFIQKDNNVVRLDIEDISIGKSIKVKFKNFNCREDSEEYIGEEIFINENQLDVLEENQFYWNEIIGLTAYLNNGKKIGIVSDIIETGSNDVLVIKGEEEILVPYVFGESVMEVVVKEKKIIINEAYCE